MTRRRWLWVVCGASLLGPVGCEWGDSGPPNPLKLPVSTPPLGTGGSELPGPVPDGGVPKRTVTTRNPFGGPPGNLLYDGDFELSADPGSPNLMGWVAYNPSTGPVSFPVETGGLCRSGLRCAVMRRGLIFIGWGASAQGVGMAASIWAQMPPERSCDAVDPMIIEWIFGTGKHLEPVGPEPNEDGWCHYEASMPKQGSAVSLYIESSLGIDQVALLDAARLEPSTGTVPMASSHRAISAAEGQRARAAYEWFRKRRPVGLPPEAPKPPQR